MPLPLTKAIALLRRRYGRPRAPPTRDPFELILIENIAYLASPERRREAFALLKQTVGTTPAAILGASRPALERVTAHGILKARFADKLRTCARIAIALGGDLAAALRGPLAQALRILRRFPGVAGPGADRILLFSGRHASLAPESNALRVLARLGYIEEGASYARMYRAGNAAAAQLPARFPTLMTAHLLLHEHGRTLCRRTRPLCAKCPLRRDCAHARRTEDRR